MRVVLTTNFSPWSPYVGGGQRSTHNLATALAGRGHEVVVVYTRGVGEQIDVPGDLGYEVRWAALPARKSRREIPLRPLSAVTVSTTLARIMSQAPVDALHGNGEEAALVPVLRHRFRFVFVMTPRYPHYPAALQDPPRGMAARIAAAMREPKFVALGQALRAADWVCPTSQSARGMVERAYDLRASKIRVIPNGIDATFAEATWTPDALVAGPIVFFGRLSPSKGADTLLEALALLGDEAPACRIVGRGESENALRTAIDAKGLSRVTLVGWESSPAIAGRLSTAAMAVLPSREESFGNAMAETMAVGTPLVTTRVGSIPEIVEHDRTGVLVPPDDPAALAEAIAALRCDPSRAARLGHAAREEVRARYTWPRVAEAFESLYRRAG